MADYEDQNSSEYKDMNQETQAADQNPHSAGNVPQNPNPAQPDQQNPPQNDGQIPPQNSGQNPYWQNQQNGGQIPPQNPGQDPYWQIPQNGRQIPPQHPGQDPYWQNQQNSGQFPPQNGQPPYWQNQYNNGQPPYWQNQPQRPRREKNSFATISLISGIFALLTLCCFPSRSLSSAASGRSASPLSLKKASPSGVPQQPESSSALSPFFSASASSSMYSPSQT